MKGALLTVWAMFWLSFYASGTALTVLVGGYILNWLGWAPW